MKIRLAFIAAFALAGAAHAQEEEIVVTGSRIAAYERDFVPVIHQKKRADFMAASVIVESDSRDYALRRDEVLKTLRSMADRADREQGIDLGIARTVETDDDEVTYVVPFARSALTEAILSGGQRSDTTRTTIIVKTPVAAADTFESAKARIEAFTKSVPATGRAQLIDDEQPGLSVVDIGQYRAPLLRAIAADAKAVGAMFGEDYRVMIEGLDKPVRWRVTGPLELAIYFPYESGVELR